MKSKAKHHHEHGSHAEAVLRLKRAKGHLEKVINMIEKHDSCVDVLQQLTAVTSALLSCKTLLLQDHINSCIRPAMKAGNENLIDEIETIIARALKRN